MGYTAKNYSETARKAIIEGIGRIFEEGSENGMDVLALHVAPERFVIINRFYEEVSEARIREDTEKSYMIAQDSIRRVYSVQIGMQTCSPFFRIMRYVHLFSISWKKKRRIQVK